MKKYTETEVNEIAARVAIQVMFALTETQLDRIDRKLDQMNPTPEHLFQSELLTSPCSVC